MGLCDECDELEQNMRAAVKAGGVYFECKGCGTTGVLRAEAELAIATREHLGKTNGEPCGVEIEACGQKDCTGTVVEA